MFVFNIGDVDLLFIFIIRATFYEFTNLIKSRLLQGRNGWYELTGIVYKIRFG